MSDARTTKYDMIKDTFRQKIREGEWKPGDQVPSINEIMETFLVSKVTAVRALSELETAHYVLREQGRGTFVSSKWADILQSQAHRPVTAIVPDMTNAFHAEIVNSLARPLRENGIAIELSCTDYNPKAEEELFQKALRGKHHLAIVMIPSILSNHHVKVPPQIPVVLVDYCPAHLLDSCVFIHGDNHQGGRLAAEHLASLGHKNIGYITRVYGGPDRLTGFRKRLADHGVVLEDSHVFVTEPGPLGKEVVDFVAREKLTALFTLNDMIAMQAMQALRQEGYRIPEDISLIGYDDISASRYLEVPLTSIEQYEEQIGQKAAECILEKAQSPGSVFRAKEIVIMPHIVERASTGPAPQE